MAPAAAWRAGRVALLSVLALSVLADAADPRRPSQRLADDVRADGRASSPRASSRVAVATTLQAPSSPPSGRHHENALELVRWAPALASAAAWVREDGRNGDPGGGGARLSVNASSVGGSSGGGGGGQVVHASETTRAAEPLRVSWSGLPDASVDDMIAVLLLGDDDEDDWGRAANLNLSSAAPAKFALLGGAAAPSGSLDLRLANYLSPRVALVLLRGGLDETPRLGAPPLVLRNDADGRAPLHRRLSLAAAPAPAPAPEPSSSSPSPSPPSVALAVRWTTRLPGGSPGVWWTAQPPPPTEDGGEARPQRAYEHFAPALAASGADTYSRSDLCGDDAAGVGFVAPGHFHTAVMGGLVPGRRYWYVVGDGGGSLDDAQPPRSSSSLSPPPPPPPEEAVRSPEASFLAPPGAVPSSSSGAEQQDDQEGRVRVLVTADMGQAEPDGWSQALSYTTASSVRTARALAAELVLAPPPAAAAAVAASAAAAAAASPDDGGAPLLPPSSPAPPISLVLHAGDLSYARGYGALWAAFHDLVEPIAEAVPYMVAPGNHERNWPASGDRFSAGTGEAGARAAAAGQERGEGASMSGSGSGETGGGDSARGGGPARDVFDSGGECGVPYARRFAMPEGGSIVSAVAVGTPPPPPTAATVSSSSPPGAGDRPWYAFDHGPHVRFVVFSTEHDFMPGSEQHAFLERAFAGARGNGSSSGSGDGDAPRAPPAASAASDDDGEAARPWLVLVGHRPIHVCSSWDGPADSDAAVSRALRHALAPLMERYAVDLTVSGHHHSYGRTCAVLEEEGEGENEGEEGRAGGGAAGVGGGRQDSEGRRAWRLGRPTCAPEPPFASSSSAPTPPASGSLRARPRRGTVHLVAGNGGAPLTLNAALPPSPVWRRLRYDWGYLRLDATAGRLRVESVTAAGEVVDAFELVR